jgi:hypothetical protein
MPAERRIGGFQAGRELRGLHRVGLGNDNLVADGGGVERLKHVGVGL